VEMNFSKKFRRLEVSEHLNRDHNISKESDYKAISKPSENSQLTLALAFVLAITAVDKREYV